MSDSSTQHGREFEHIMCTILAKSDLSDTYHEGTQLIRLRNSGQPFDDALANQERQIMATLKSRIMHWHLPLLRCTIPTSLARFIYIQNTCRRCSVTILIRRMCPTWRVGQFTSIFWIHRTMSQSKCGNIVDGCFSTNGTFSVLCYTVL